MQKIKKQLMFAITVLLCSGWMSIAMANCCPPPSYGAGNCNGCSGGTNSCTSNGHAVCCFDPAKSGDGSKCVPGIPNQ